MLSKMMNPMSNAFNTVAGTIFLAPGVLLALPTSATPVAGVLTYFQTVLASVGSAGSSLAQVPGDLITYLATTTISCTDRRCGDGPAPAACHHGRSGDSAGLVRGAAAPVGLPARSRGGTGHRQAARAAGASRRHDDGHRWRSVEPGIGADEPQGRRAIDGGARHRRNRGDGVCPPHWRRWPCRVSSA